MQRTGHLVQRADSYPYVTRGDILVTMSQEAYSLFTPQLKDDGILIIEQGLVLVEKLPHGVRVDGVPSKAPGRRIRKAHGTEYRYGRFHRRRDQRTGARFDTASRGRFGAPAFRELNLKVFDKGFEYGTKHLSADLENEEQPTEFSTLEQ